jgi:hypothetical protein
VPLLALYAPLRTARIREVRAVRRALGESRGDPVFEQFLARRAAERLPYCRLRLISPDPWHDLATGHYERLAAAELRRLDLARKGRRLGTRARAWPEGAGG